MAKPLGEIKRKAKPKKAKKRASKRPRGYKPAEDAKALVETLKQWQQIEKDTIMLTQRIGRKSKNPLVQTLMKVIQNDSKMHFKVQKALIDSMTDKAFSLTPEELGDMWEMIDKHAQMEKRTIELAEEALGNCRLFAQRQLLIYLLEDERKHDKILGQLENFKRKIYPYL
jgi:rubrerythrin